MEQLWFVAWSGADYKSVTAKRLFHLKEPRVL